MHASDCDMDLEWSEENVGEHYGQKETVKNRFSNPTNVQIGWDQ